MDCEWIIYSISPKMSYFKVATFILNKFFWTWIGIIKVSIEKVLIKTRDKTEIESKWSQRKQIMSTFITQVSAEQKLRENWGKTEGKLRENWVETEWKLSGSCVKPEWKPSGNKLKTEWKLSESWKIILSRNWAMLHINWKLTLIHVWIVEACLDAMLIYRN